VPDLELSCPLPLSYERIVMAHGGGGRLMQQLLEKIVLPQFGNPFLDRRHDSAVLDVGGQKIAFTTDSYVVKPVFFPGGDIGKLAVCGTLNDLAMSGAKPLYLSCALIVEEGFALQDLQRVLASMQEAARHAGVLIVTGDTKVVDNGKGDGIYINTAGIGLVAEQVNVHPERIRAGDAVLLSGDLARHGIAVMLEREGLAFDSAIASDCADLSGVVQNLINDGIDIHCMRDLTRGGLASCLIEIAAAARCHIDINETAVPVRGDVKSACEILGFDPLYIANEGCCALFVAEEQAERALSVLRKSTLGTHACRIGNVHKANCDGLLTLQTPIGASRVLDMFSGEQLPRIC
jgi:hydrogenase expression/formation protein HypE